MRTGLLGLLLASCGANPSAECADEPLQTGVISKLGFARADDRVSVGYNLDGHSTEAGAGDGCGIADYLHPDGTPGIDNSLAAIIPALELTEAVATEALLQGAINSGELLLLWQLSGYDGAEDSCAGFRFFRGAGDPLLGTDNVLVSGQSFDVDDSVPAVVSPAVSLSDGSFEVTDLSLEVPLQIFDAVLDLRIENANMRVELDTDGSFTGYLGGSLDYQQILDMADDANIDPVLAEALPVLFASVADLEPDTAGTCERMSVTLVFEGVSAYTFTDPTSSP